MEGVVVFLVVFNIYVFFEIQREKKRNRILLAFIGALVECSQKSISAIERANNKNYEDVNSREYLMDAIGAWLKSDFWDKPLRKWLAKDKALFYDDNYSNGFFNRMYQELHERLQRETNLEETQRE